MSTSPTYSAGPHAPATRLLAAPLLACVLGATGCAPMLLPSLVYLWQGGNVVPAECKELEKKRVVVFCRPPASSEYRYAGAARQLTKRISELLKSNVPKVDVVDPSEVDEWIDENDTDNFKDLGTAVKADRVVRVEIEHFELFKGKTLYQGVADISVSVYDMEQNGVRVWDREMGEVMYPVNSGVPVQDKPLPQFQREYIEVLAQQIAMHFYKHDAHATFAIDALANR